MATRYAWDLADKSQIPQKVIQITPSNSDEIRTTMRNGDVVRGVRGLRSENAGIIRVIQMEDEQNETTADLYFKAGETRTGMFLRVLSSGTSVLTDSADTGIEGLI